VRLNAIELAWFRGAADSVALAPDGKSMVVYGPNGAGKSSFVDGIEYILHNGKIEHLVSEYSGRHQERAIPNTHKPADRVSNISFTFADRTKLEINIASNGLYTRSGGETVGIERWDYRRTVLRQDEVAEFVRSRKGEKYSALLPLFGLGELEIAAENLRQLVKSVEHQSSLEKKRGALVPIGDKRRRIFGKDTDAEIEAKVVELHTKHCPLGIATNALDRCWELESAIAVRMGALTAENLRHLATRLVAGIDLRPIVTAAREANAKLAGSVEPLIAEKLSVLRSARDFAAKLEGAGEVRCPACGKNVAAAEFKAHVGAEQDRLRVIMSTFDDRGRALGAMVDGLKAVKVALAKPELDDLRASIEATKTRPDLEWVEGCDPESYRNSASDADFTEVERHAQAIVAAADAASRDAPPDIAELSRDQAIADGAKSVFEAMPIAGEISRIEGLLAFVNALEGRIRAEIREHSESVIGEISADIAAMWASLHPREPIENVGLSLPDEDKAIDVALRFYGKDQDSPRLTLSEGYRNSLGLCIFLALAKQEASSDRPLILDDVVVSFDRGHRGMIAELLEKQFADRQVIVFTHDRDWYAELRHQLPGDRWSFKSLLPYESPTLGIRWSDKTTSFAEAKAHISSRPDSACNDARKVMDVELSLISERVQIRLPYLRGERNDHRMSNDFLERLIGDGAKCLQKKSGNDYPIYAAGLEELTAAHRLLVTWANRASHTQDATPAEASKLIDACEKALAVFHCGGCEKHLWFSDADGPEWTQCQCGDLRWRYGKG
jgi:energy-coupling factor transporter ATP-binding protein EcfA2